MTSRFGSNARVKLLTYPMALAQPEATVPLVGAVASAGGDASGALTARRWVRSAEESCVASVHRSSRLLTNYVASYKFSDPQWSALLALPCGNPIATELRSRHVNFALRHLVQKGHAVYLITHSQHTVLHPRGLIEQSMATCSFGIKGERLRTNIVHEGPIDVRDKDGERGVVAVSQVEGYGTWFQRKPMLWQRSRRIGALQASMGAFNWSLCAPEEVGRNQDCEVLLLKPHVQYIGSAVQAVGIVASSQIAQHPYLYLGEFDAPVPTALDAVHQLAHVSALHNKLVSPPITSFPARPVSPEEGNEAAADAGVAKQDSTQPKESERISALAWVTRSPPPYVPLEADLPFKLQMSSPVVFAADDEHDTGTVGTPFHTGASLFRTEYNMHQGMEHYVFDDSPSSRPMKWWSQKNNLPYSGHMYFVRDGNIDKLHITEKVQNPFAKEARRRPLHTIVPPNKNARRRMERYAKAQRNARERSASTSQGVQSVSGAPPPSP